MKQWKQLIAGLAAFVVTVSVYAALDATLLTHVAILLPQEQAEAGVLAGPAFDRSSFTGTGVIIVSVGASDTNTTATTVQLQHATAATGTFANVAGAAATFTGATGGTNGAVKVIPVDLTGGNRYWRLLVTTTNGTAPVSATLSAWR